MLAYVIYNRYESERNAWFINELIKEFNTLGIDLILIIEEYFDIDVDNKSLIYNQRIIDLPKFVINRTNNYIFSMKFESFGIRVFNNSKVSQISNNKYLTYLKMSAIGVPLLKTQLLNKENLNNIEQFPVVIKPISGKGGKDVYLCNDKYELNINANKIKDSDFIVQEFSNNPGKDLRVYVIGNSIYKAILRVSKDGFISNYCLGNDAIIYNLNDNETKLVNKIIESDSFDYVGIDFLFHNDELVLNEIEDSVGARMLYDKTDLNVARDLAKYICSVL